MTFSKKLLLCFLSIIRLQSTLLTDCNINCKNQNISQNLWQPRSFSSYKSREIIMLQDHKTRENLLSFAMEYMQNFGSSSDRLGSLPFWSGTNTMTIGNNDGTSDLDAYQFGLGEVTQIGSITLQPKIQHVGTEMLWRVAHSSDKAGGYFQIKAPLGAMIIDTKICETPAKISPNQDPDWSSYPTKSVRYKTLTEALTANFEHREPDLKFGRLHPGKDTVIRCGDIETVVGYNFYSSETGYFGAGFKVSCPTGNTPEATFLLEPIFGRAGHWGLGAEAHGNCKLHESTSHILFLTVRGDILHLISGRRPNWRSFDLALNGPGSKYLLVQRYLPGINADGEETRMAGEIASAIDITTVPVLSTIPLEGSFAIALNAQRKHWNASFIVELWGRSKESLKIDCEEISKHKEELLNDFAILGRQIDQKDIESPMDMPPTDNLYYCEPLAKINKSVPRKNEAGKFDNDVKDARQAFNRIPRDYNVALDIAGAQAPRTFTAKLTGEIGYIWTDSNLTPHLSLFGGIEFANKNSKFDNIWSLGLQGSMKF